MMGVSETIYDLFLLPLEKIRLEKIRKQLLWQVKGNVLEIGSGTGVNLKHYDFSKINEIDLIDIEITQKLTHYKFPKHISFAYRKGDVESLPYKDHTFDYVVFTLVFCSVRHPLTGLLEIKRVLKPGGRIIFIEHVLPENKHLKSLFQILTPAWKKLAANCHLNRETQIIIEKAGFHIEKSQRFFKGTFIYGVGSIQ